MKLFFYKNQEQKMEYGRWNLEWLRSIFNIQNSIFYPKAFTLIELMVSVAIFSTAVVIGVGALYSAQQVNVKLQATHIIMDSLNISLEVMTRNMSYGSSFYCVTTSDNSDTDGENVGLTNNCPFAPSGSPGGKKIVFKTIQNGTNDRTAYYVDSNKRLIEKVITRSNPSDGPITKNKQISSDDITIDNLQFYVVGAKKATDGANADTEQPMITVVLSGKTKVFGNSPATPFVLQSSITARN